ncbi:YMR253C [Symbiodinium sp. CCMP2592]|nr:YMR253C [Symbiodinium sp. CCMP2592]
MGYIDKVHSPTSPVAKLFQSIEPLAFLKERVGRSPSSGGLEASPTQSGTDVTPSSAWFEDFAADSSVDLEKGGGSAMSEAFRQKRSEGKLHNKVVAWEVLEVIDFFYFWTSRRCPSRRPIRIHLTSLAKKASRESRDGKVSAEIRAFTNMLQAVFWLMVVTKPGSSAGRLLTAASTLVADYLYTASKDSYYMPGISSTWGEDIRVRFASGSFVQRRHLWSFGEFRFLEVDDGQHSLWACFAKPSELLLKRLV